MLLALTDSYFVLVLIVAYVYLIDWRLIAALVTTIMWSSMVTCH